ncbi:23239_t:CDS:2 [Gigaspora margarita]|uniref:23239_t:CDS:1 n=1 Tax=Gigaspora margarita TaxID=4874 RepID=A0ABN7UBF0_GIGMA|nr:23239_t:CDS:2 [Gigaspora margarita]
MSIEKFMGINRCESMKIRIEKCIKRPIIRKKSLNTSVRAKVCS